MISRWTLIAVLLVATNADAQQHAGMERTLNLPPRLVAGGAATLAIQVGPLAPGQRIRVTTADGVLLGTIAPFGPAARRSAGSYSIPVPPEALRDGTLSVRVTLVAADQPPRAPTGAELRSLELQALGEER